MPERPTSSRLAVLHSPCNAPGSETARNDARRRM
jgi:hypothetical protein